MNKNNDWKCVKCNQWISSSIDRDYHDNTEHPNFYDAYIASWILRGRPGLSPYD